MPARGRAREMAGKAKKTGKAKKAAPKKRGAKPLFASAAEMQQKIDLFFATRDEENPPTYSGLALALGFCDRQSLYDYAARSEEFSCTIKKARARVDEAIEKMGMTGKGSASFLIFALKNHGWTDEIKAETKTTIVMKTVADLRKEIKAEGGRQ